MGLIFFAVFTEKVIHCFNESDCSKFDPISKELLFGILNSPRPSFKKSTTVPFYLCVITFIRES